MISEQKNVSGWTVNIMLLDYIRHSGWILKSHNVFLTPKLDIWTKLGLPNKEKYQELFENQRKFPKHQNKLTTIYLNSNDGCKRANNARHDKKLFETVSSHWDNMGFPQSWSIQKYIRIFNTNLYNL